MIGGKTRETIFPETWYSAKKNMLGKNRRKKVRKTFFFYFHTNIVPKKWGEKRAKQFFRNTRKVRSKMLGKIRRKKVRTTFLYIHTNIVQKK